MSLEELRLLTCKLRFLTCLLEAVQAASGAMTAEKRLTWTDDSATLRPWDWQILFSRVGESEKRVRTKGVESVTPPHFLSASGRLINWPFSNFHDCLLNTELTGRPEADQKILGAWGWSPQKLHPLRF